MIEAPRLDVIVKKVQPVAYPVLGHHAPATSRKAASRQVMAESPPTPGIEAGNDHMAVGTENPVHFAQHRVGINRGFEQMWQENGIYRIRGHGEVFGSAHEVHARTAVSRDYGVPLCAGMAAEQVWSAPGANLQELIAKDVFEDGGNLTGLLEQQGGTSACLQPVRAHAAILAHARRAPYNGLFHRSQKLEPPMGFLAGKRVLIVGVASERSIAWGIAQAMSREGANLAYTYQTERLGERVRELAAITGSSLCLPLDVAEDNEITGMYEALAANWSSIDAIVHSVAFAPRDQLTGSYLDSVTRDGFRIAHDISSYSFAALAKYGRPLLSSSSALLTLSYLGAVRAIPNYNVMGPAKASLEANVRFMAAELGATGTRVNGISAGPIKTLAAAGISGFRTMLQSVANSVPIRRNVTIEDVGNAAAFLCSDLAAGITGEILYVDGGYSRVGMSF